MYFLFCKTGLVGNKTSSFRMCRETKKSGKTGQCITCKNVIFNLLYNNNKMEGNINACIRFFIHHYDGEIFSSKRSRMFDLKKKCLSSSLHLYSK